MMMCTVMVVIPSLSLSIVDKHALCRAVAGEPQRSVQAVRITGGAACIAAKSVKSVLACLCADGTICRQVPVAVLLAVLRKELQHGRIVAVLVTKRLELRRIKVEIGLQQLQIARVNLGAVGGVPFVNGGVVREAVALDPSIDRTQGIGTGTGEFSRLRLGIRRSDLAGLPRCGQETVSSFV